MSDRPLTHAGLVAMLGAPRPSGLVSVELCAGGGGSAAGLDQAGFRHELLVEIDADACQTLRLNRPGWRVACADISRLDGSLVVGQVDLLSAGLPCTPHSRGGRQLGISDERHLWAEAMRIVSEVRPRSVMFETSDAILGPRFDAERSLTRGLLIAEGYQQVYWKAVDCSRYGVPQRRTRAVLIAFRDVAGLFRWPEPLPGPPPTLGDALFDLVAAGGWPGAAAWRAGAQAPAPTVSIGSKLHGGADLGPSQTKRAFARLGVDGLGLADGSPDEDGKYIRGYRGRTGIIGDAGQGVMLTPRMVARLQGFPDTWQFCGGKTSAGRQIGNAFPPHVARALGLAIRNALEAARLWTSPSAPGRNRAISVPSLP